MMASYGGHPSTVELLMEKGAELEAKKQAGGAAAGRPGSRSGASSPGGRQGGPGSRPGSPKKHGHGHGHKKAEKKSADEEWLERYNSKKASWDSLAKRYLGGYTAVLACSLLRVDGGWVASADWKPTEGRKGAYAPMAALVWPSTRRRSTAGTTC